MSKTSKAQSLAEQAWPEILLGLAVLAGGYFWYQHKKKTEGEWQGVPYRLPGT